MMTTATPATKSKIAPSRMPSLGAPHTPPGTMKKTPTMTVTAAKTLRPMKAGKTLMMMKTVDTVTAAKALRPPKTMRRMEVTTGRL